MTVLLTGAQGFLGRAVADQLQRRGAVVLGVGRSAPDGLFAGAGGQRRYARVDLCDTAAVRRLVIEARPELVIHLAGALRDECWSDLVAVNVTATGSLVAALGVLTSPPPIIVASSGSVYGRQARLPSSEDATVHPVGAYARSKLMGEMAARAAGRRHCVQVTVARVFNLLGPGLQRRHLASRLAHELAAIEAGQRPPRIVTGALQATRDFVDVRDAAEMLVTAAAAPERPDVINVASGVETPVRDLAWSLVARAAAPVELVEVASAPAPPGADRQVADVGRARTLGLAARIPLGRSLDEMLADARRSYAPSGCVPADP